MDSKSSKSSSAYKMTGLVKTDPITRVYGLKDYAISYLQMLQKLTGKPALQ
jgi:hypothetical protein